MGIGVSNWRLANAVARLGQLGVVSGVAIDTVLARRLQDGDPGGHMRRAMAHFPIPGVAAEALARYFRPGGREPGKPYALLPMYQQAVSRARDQFSVLSSFVEVWLAKEGHDGLVGINLLTKIQMGNLAFLYGAMLAGVDYVIMGAGIPREIPGALDALAQHQPAQLRLEVEGAAAGQAELPALRPGRRTGPAPRRRRWCARASCPSSPATCWRPCWCKKATGRIDGFVIEGPTAGGHNAPPRDRGVSAETGEPLYGPRDVVDLEQIRKLGLPFWVAGGEGRPDRLRQALATGAAGHPGRHALRLLRRVGDRRAHPPLGPGERPARDGARPHRRARLAHRLPVQAGLLGGRPGRRRGPQAHLRPRLPARRLRPRREGRRVPLRQRARGPVRRQGRRAGGDCRAASACATPCSPPSGSGSSARTGRSSRPC